MALNGFIEFFQKGKVGGGLRGANVCSKKAFFILFISFRVCVPLRAYVFLKFMLTKRIWDVGLLGTTYLRVALEFWWEFITSLIMPWVCCVFGCSIDISSKEAIYPRNDTVFTA